MCEPVSLGTALLVGAGTAAAGAAVSSMNRPSAPPAGAPAPTKSDVAGAADDMIRRYALSRNGFEADFNTLGDTGDGSLNPPLRAVRLGV